MSTIEVISIVARGINLPIVSQHFVRQLARAGEQAEPHKISAARELPCTCRTEPPGTRSESIHLVVSVIGPVD